MGRGIEQGGRWSGRLRDRVGIAGRPKFADAVKRTLEQVPAITPPAIAADDGHAFRPVPPPSEDIVAIAYRYRIDDAGPTCEDGAYRYIRFAGAQPVASRGIATAVQRGAL